MGRLLTVRAGACVEWLRRLDPARGGRPGRRAMAAASYALLLVSCESPFAPNESAVSQLVATPPSTTISVGETRAVTVRVLDSGGNTIGDRRLFWSSQNPTVATVSQAGIVNGVSAGATQIAVSAGGKSALIPVTVNARPVSLVRVTPATASVVAGATTQLVAQALDAGGETVADRPVLWATNDGTVATVTSTGLVSGVAAGTTNITATIDGVVGSSVLTVQPVPIASIAVTPSTNAMIVGAQLQLTAIPRSATDVALLGRPIAWSSSTPSTASVSSTGVVTALSPGTATITATAEGVSGSARITVSFVPIDTLSLTPRSATVAAGQSLQLVARIVDATGALLSGRVITWNTDQPTIATVNTTGLVSALTAGRATISASAEGKSATATVTVSPVPVASVSILPAAATILIGMTQQFTATTRDASNNLLPGRSITWISGAPSVATVTQSGLVTAVGAGSALIFAASEGISTSVTVTVSTVGVAKVLLSPPTATVQQGRTVQLAAQPVDAGGAPITGRTVVWNSSASNVASVSSTGLVSGIAPGTADITATVDGVIGTRTITVTAIPVASVSIVPANPTLTVGQTVALTALLADANGSPLSPVGRNIGWAATAPGIATVSLTGDVTAVSAGTTIVQATVEGVIAQTTVTVTGIPVATVTLAPATTSLNIGATRTVTATARDAGGNVLTGRPVLWTSSAPAVASVSTVNSSGTNTITAVSTGTATITAKIGGVQGVSTVTVTNVPIASITLTPSPALVEEFATTQLTATVLDATSKPLTGRTLLWVSSNNVVASVSQTGLVTANIPGTVTITASAPGQGIAGSTPSGTTAVNVTLAPVGSAAITPSPLSVTTGSTAQPSVTLLSSAGQALPITGRTITWSLLTTPTNAATINSSTGLVTGVASGTGTITVSASSPGQLPPITATAPVNISSVQIARVAFTPMVGTLHIGSTYARVVTAQAFDANNNVLPGRLIAWSTEANDPNISVSTSSSTTGQVTLTGNNSPAAVHVIATAQGASGAVADTMTVTTTLVPIASTTSTVTLNPTQPDSVVNVAGQVRAYTATPRDSAGNVLSGVALGGRTPTWTSSPGAAISAVGASANATPVSVGTVTITASYATAAPTATLRVLVPAATVLVTISSDSMLVGGSSTLSATAVDAANSAIPGRLVRVTSNSPSIAAIASASAPQTLVTSINGVSAPAGRNTATLVATAPFDSVSASSAFVPTTRTAIVLAPVTSVAVSTPAGTDSILVNGTVQATSTLRDANSNILVGRTVTWSTGDALIATAAQTGVVTGGSAGATTIIAREGVSGLSGTKSLLVQEPVSSVALTAAATTIVVGQTQPTTVTLLDRFSAPLIGRVVAYASSANSVATVDATGVITGVGKGTADITATSEGKTSPAVAMTVDVVPVSRVSVAATPTPTVYPSHIFPATVQAFDASNNSLSLAQRTIVWSSSNAGFATVSAGAPGAATITAIAPGTVTISATVDGVAATTPISITIRPVPVVSITFAPPTGSVSKGDTAIVFTATPRDSANGALAGRVLSWSTVNPNKVTIIGAATGLIAAIDSGSATVTATAVGAGVGGADVSASTSISISLIAITSVVITPSTLTLPSTTGTGTLLVDVQGKQTPAASPRPLVGRACTATSSNPGMLSVSPGNSVTNTLGQVSLTVTGLTAGTVTVTVACDANPTPQSTATATVTVP